jgi:methylglutamate dehydrogenase subunit D
VADLALSPRSAFADLLHDHGAAPAGLTVTDLDGAAIVSALAFNGRQAELSERVRTAYGALLPSAPRRVAAGRIAFIGVGDGRWLATGEGAGASLAADLAARLEGLAAIVDQTDGYGLLRLWGPALRNVLAKGVGVDLHPAAFPVGAAAATMVAHIGVTLWRLEDAPDGAPVFDIALFRSVAGSFWHWLSSSAAEFGLAVETAAPG